VAAFYDFNFHPQSNPSGKLGLNQHKSDFSSKIGDFPSQNGGFEQIKLVLNQPRRGFYQTKCGCEPVEIWDLQHRG
jgi:hypothetical protein